MKKRYVTVQEMIMQNGGVITTPSTSSSSSSSAIAQSKLYEEKGFERSHSSSSLMKKSGSNEEDEEEQEEYDDDTAASKKSPEPPLYKIVLTGGPCGGKTTSLARLSSFLRQRGFQVMTCPEAFSILINNGMSMNYYAEVKSFASTIQCAVMDMQLTLEDSMVAILRATQRPSVLLCDRGLMDGHAYCTNDQWETLLAQRGLESSCPIREGRYNAVFHLVTAAEGAEQYYTLENNVVRTETPEVARTLDQRTRAAWLGHPKLLVFDNSTDFEGKIQRLVNATAKLVGLPSSLARSSIKFLLKNKPQLRQFPPDVTYHIFEVDKVYIYDNKSSSTFVNKDNTNTENEGSSSTSYPCYVEEYSFIRKRTQVSVASGDGATKTSAEIYGQTTVKRTNDGHEVEIKRIISKREYNMLYKARDMSRNIVKQTRISFLWNMQSFTIHIYSQPIKVKDLCVLHCQLEVPNANITTINTTTNNNNDNNDDVNHHQEKKHNNNGKDIESLVLPPFLDIGRKLLPNKEDDEKYGAYGISLIDENN